MTEPARWLGLIALSAATSAGFGAIHLSASLLLGPMVAAIALAAAGGSVRVPPLAFAGAQAIVGCMIGRTIRPSLLREIGASWPIFVIAVTSVIGIAVLLGTALTRWRVMPGTAALWGSFPGAATAMTLMADAYGADIRLVAFMQYFRAILATLVASAVTWIWVGPVAAPAIAAAPIDAHALAATLVLATLGAVAGARLRIPAGPLLFPMVLGAVLQDLGLMTIELPEPLLALAYAVVGWSIGLRFTRDILGHVVRVLPRVAAAIATLVALCALLAAALVRWGGIDPLTAYLATSPGGADSVAIIAASSHNIDVPFVMAMQITRFLVVLLLGPGLARFIADRIEAARR